MFKRSFSIILAITCLFGCLAVFSACGSDDAVKGKTDETIDKNESSVEISSDDTVVSGDASETDSAVVDDSSENSDVPAETSDTESTGADVSSEETTPMIYEDIPENAIDNSYFEFKYYDDWKENVRFETKESDDGRYEILCRGVGIIEGFHAFSIVFADCNGMEDHYYIGELNGTPVYTYVNQNYEGLSEDQINLLNETVLSYYMNDLTYQLKDVDGFVTKQ